MSSLARRTGILILLCLAWQYLPKLFHTPTYLFPTLTTVLTEFDRGVADGRLVHALLLTLKLLFEGVLIGGLCATVLAAMAILTRTGKDILETLTAIFNPLPAIAILPVALLWFGFSGKAIVFAITLSVVWPMAISAYTGFATIRKVTINVGNNLGLRPVKLLWCIYLPAALPHLLAGFRQGWAFAWRTGVAAELVYGAAGGSGGIGWQIYVDRANLNTPGVFSGLLVIIIVGLVIEYGILQTIQRATVVRWGMVSQ